ncbi:putative EPS-depolymerase [Erwinia phage vB_EamP_Gutmeister]|uniref:Putative EPS-depolymerase n=1 Tax=Erwinia phage vB_EamP_Gutmeister TaxID=1852643 RepID=A0A191ZDC1_9CAUD|nr:putative EPS-depolymerase [Erwinia phage vB_EamP_Gutmeister]
MNMRTVNNNVSPGGNALLVDKFIGNAYDTVRFVALNMSFIKHVSFHLKEVYDVAHHMDELVRVAADLGNIDIVAGIADDVVTLAAQAQGLIDLAAKLQELMTLHDNLPALLDLEANTPALVDLHSHQAEILAVYAQLPDIAALVPKLNEIGAVYTNLAQVVAVGDNIASVKNVSDNMERILNVEAELALINQVANQVDELIAQIAAVETGIYAKFAAPDGLKNVGQVATWAALATTVPTVAGQRVFLKEYAAGTGRGGGLLIAVNAAGTEDGGYRASVNANWHWRRDLGVNEMTITQFGAVTDGVTDDMPAVKRMFAWSRSIDVTFNPGIRLPAGPTALSSFDNGTTEIPSFIMTGAFNVYGRLPSSRIVSVNPLSTTPMFSYKARRMSVSNIAVIGTDTSVQPFMVNTVTRGDYCRLSCIQARSWGARAFHVYDTIDTTLDQIYSSQGRGSFFRTDWSNENPGAWDHPTAIKLTDANFEGHTGEYAFSAIRAGQSVMEDVWFDHCNQGFDISQGGWLLKNVTQENSVLPSASQYAKVILIKCRFAQGAGLSADVSGYDPSQDPSGSMPSWVNSVYERGTANLDVLGFINTGSMSFGYESSQYKMANMTENAVWFEVGTLGFSGATGVSCDIELVGTGHFDSAVAGARPASTNYGGGKAVIRVQQKDSDTKMAASWYGEQASPISDVRILLGNKNRPRLFVCLRGYTGGVATTFHTNDKSNFEGGQHFYLSPVFATIDMATVPAAVQVPAHWSVNNSSSGLGMNLTDGKVVIDGPALQSTNASPHLPIQYNGTDIFLATQPSTQSTRVQHCTVATLPRAVNNPWSFIIVTDAVTGNGVTQKRLCFCDGEFWYLADGSVSFGSGRV